MALLCAGILLVIVGIAVSTLVWQGWQLLALLLMGTMLLLIGLALFLIGQVRSFSDGIILPPPQGRSCKV